MNILKYFSLLLFFTSCYQKEFIQLQGNAQGTTFNIKYSHPKAIVFDSEIDSILRLIDLQLSVYLPNSTISKFNNSDNGIEIDSIIDEHFLEVFEQSKLVYQQTNGYFNPCVKSLYKYWNFDDLENGILEIDTLIVDSLLKLSNFDLIHIDKDSIYQIIYVHKPINYQIDFNAIAQGYTVDVIGDFLKSKDVTDFMIEIGGEVKVYGENPQNKQWTIGIEKPTQTDSSIFQKIIELKDEAIATSGSYRKFFILNGKKYAHVINPKTGYPIQHNLLSTSVIFQSSSFSDAYATALLAMGKELAEEFIKNSPLKLKAYFIYEENKELKTEDFL